jgi:hypothetical protein
MGRCDAGQHVPAGRFDAAPSGRDEDALCGWHFEYMRDDCVTRLMICYAQEFLVIRIGYDAVKRVRDMRLL